MTGSVEGVGGVESRRIIDVRVDVLDYGEAVRRICSWASRGESRTVCACNVHMVMEAHDHEAVRAAIQAADLVVPDGMPLVWALRRLGVPDASRVYGPRLMEEVMQAAATQGLSVGLYGGDPETLATLETVVQQRWPTLPLVYRHSPPFGAARFSDAAVREVALSGARILFVALGCPKQEQWMHLHRGALPAVMLGVGAAFDFLAGTKPQAPNLLQRVGLEWAFRLATEPRRLWRRYAVHNPRFVALLARQLMGPRA